MAFRLPPPRPIPIPTVGDNSIGPRLANARPSEKGRFAVKVAACNIQEIPGGVTRMVRDWPSSKERAAHLTVQRGTAPTRVRSTADTVADRITRVNALS